MERQRVVSTSIESIGYETNDQILEVAFHNGNVYKYDDVPATEVKKLLTADSIGAHFNIHIRDRYRNSKVN